MSGHQPSKFSIRLTGWPITSQPGHAGNLIAWFLCLTCFPSHHHFLSAQSSSAAQHSSDSVLQLHYDAAQKAQQGGRISEAERQYRLFIADALGELAIARARLAEFERAEPLFKQALLLAPNSPALQIEYAQAALIHGDLALARSIAEDVISGYPANRNAEAKGHFVLGQVFMRLNQDQQARRELEQAVSLNPSFENGYALAVVCLDMEDKECAQKVFSEMQQSFGDHASLHFQFGLAYGGSDFQDEAMEEFRKAIAEDDRLPHAHYALAVAYLATSGGSNLGAAESELKKELKISPDDFLTYAALGRIAMDQHHDEEAEGYLKHAIALNSESPDPYLYLGELCFEKDRQTEAVAALRSAIRNTGDPSRNRFQIQKAHYLLGRLLLKSGNEVEGRNELKAAQELANAALAQDKGRLAGALNPAGTADSEMTLPTVPVLDHTEVQRNSDPGEDKRADELEKRLSPPVADSFNNLGAIAAGRADYATAVEYFRNAMAWNPALEGIDYNLGKAAFAAGMYSDAIRPLTLCLRAHPNDDEIPWSACIKPVQDSEVLRRSRYASADTNEPRDRFAIGGCLRAVRRKSCGKMMRLIETGQIFRSRI